MAKPFRSPLLGYNHNLSHLGRVFHVQSEDSGPTTPRVFTHLFFQGTILVSRKQEYDAGLPDDKVRALMQTQHKGVMKDLMQGRLDERIVPFFAARGEDLVPMQGQGAIPESPLEVSGPVMVLPDVSTGDAEDRDMRDIPDMPDMGVRAPIGPRRRVTQALDPIHREAGPAPVVVHPPEVRRSPFVRSTVPAAARMSSADGVVVQRNVVVGGPSLSSARPARIRPPVPYVVTGGGHTERPPRPAATQPVAPPTLTSPLSPAPAPVSAVEAPRITGAFGLGLADDKSLDEVILEYLSEDGDSS